ncbi:methyltransferase family protein [Metarhizium acridum CQMa 102]|uniref:Methyltransferase family protein n=1 Tax=Metarhizium acridum (strain CQMa 102) TaxID=655827 RepID=E9EF12_METAQ|nr:methyltransferase family protein [Metarhizium acridum CQMa 102]EFY85513.1 methyltransferase family protein [Metarhizium acridum CQMa 102]
MSVAGGQAAADERGNRFAGTEGVYLLPHHAKEIERLKTQHAFILSSTGGVLLTAPLKPAVKVLDSGAADGTWLRDLPRLYPSTKWSLHGIDIASALFPRDAGELDLREVDIRGPPPPSLQWQGGFDLIHQRLLVWGLPGAEWPKVLKNHYSLLKPGGYIELVEAQWIDRDHSFDASKFPNLAKITKVQQWSGSNFGMDMYIAYRLEELLQQAGFKVVSKTQYSLGYGAKAREEKWREKSADMWIDTFRGFGQKWPVGGIPGAAETVEEFHALLDDLRGELLEYGVAPKINFVVGQKPE